ncbi:hypothetical protein [Botrimarina sp.]|uniref:hypothetical protein n=1 Tax=Botrimarina sp. TaxID=2795802 RepID=UPI0032EDE05E
MTSLESVYLYTAIGGGVVLLTQLGLMLLGADDGGLGQGDAAGVDADAIDSDGSTDSHGFWFFEMISLRTLAAAATFFGLAGGAANSIGWPPGVSLTVAAVAGYAAMYVVFWAFRRLLQLETSGNEDIRGAVGLPAEVYVPIAPAGGAAGKVHLTLQGRTVECQAVNDTDQPLPTGAKVLVTGVVNSDTVRVASADRPADGGAGRAPTEALQS